MSIGILDDLRSGIGPGIATLTIEQYHRMIAAGILEEDDPRELIDGILVRKDRQDTASNTPGRSDMPQGERHSGVVAQLTELLTIRCAPRGCHVRIQLPLPLPPIDEPEPDACIVRGRAREFIGRFPDRSDVLAVIEVADSSLVYDRRTKQRLYAAMSLPIYLIVNLQEDAVELYGRPIPAEQRYETRIELHRGETILMTLGELGEIRLDVDELL